MLISELRTLGPGGVEDAFVEVYNSEDERVEVSGWTLQFLNPQQHLVSVVVPQGVEIPARGNILFVGRQYSLQAAASGDVLLKERISGGIRLRDAQGTVVDAVGPEGAGTQTLAEGHGLPQSAFDADAVAAKEMAQFSWVRRRSRSEIQDSQDNEADFVLVSVSGMLRGKTTRLGAPGPQNLAASQFLVPPVNETEAPSGRGVSVVTPKAAASAQPVADSPTKAPSVARELPARRDVRVQGPNARYGTLMLRYWFVNKTGSRLSPFRLHVIGMTAGPASSPAADVRLLPTPAEKASAEKPAQNTSADKVAVWNAALDEPPLQAAGGGLNCHVTLEPAAMAPNPKEPPFIAPGEAVELRFLLGVMQRGAYQVVLDGEGFSCVFAGQTDGPVAFQATAEGSWRTSARRAAQLRAGGSMRARNSTSSGAMSLGGGSDGGEVKDDQIVNVGVLFEGDTRDSTDGDDAETPTPPGKAPSAPNPS